MNPLSQACRAEKYCVAAGRGEATAIGLEILARGGNAVDAAVAVGFALGVSEPTTSGIGGGGFLLASGPDYPQPVFLDFREVAPAATTPELLLQAMADMAPGKTSAQGGKGVAVPGEVRGLLYALKQYGTMDAAAVIGPSAQLAEEGFVITPLVAGHLGQIEDFLKGSPQAAALFLPEGRLPQAGEWFRNPDLARTLRTIIDRGEEAFYTGPLAQAMVDAVAEAGGMMTLADLAAFQITLRKPVEGSYRGLQLLSSPPPSSGGSHILQALNLLELFDVGGMEINSPDYIHLFAEVFKLVFADRAHYMADPAFVQVPVRGITDKGYAARQGQKIQLHRASQGTWGNPWPHEHDETTHYSVVDARGNMVAVTKTINDFGGSGVFVPGMGILLNNTISDFTLQPGAINAPGPGKKSLSSMSPTLVFRDGAPFAVLGSPGGPRIICAVVQVLSKLIDHGLSIADAIASPRLTQCEGDPLGLEARIPEETAAALTALGHRCQRRKDFDTFMGGVHGIRFLPEGGMEGAADPRRDGRVGGV